MPPCVTGTLFRMRVIVTNVVSKIGTASTTTGTSVAANGPPLPLHRDGEDCEHKAQEHASAIPHEDAGGLKVEDEEPGGGTCDGRGDEGHARDPDKPRDESDHGGCYSCESRGEPVHAVDQVDRVRDTDHPEKRKRDGKPERSAAPEGKPGVQDENGRQDLHDEFRFRANVVQVIREAGEEDNRSGNPDGPRVKLVSPRHHDGDDGRAEDRDPAHERHGTVVPAVFLWEGNPPGAVRQTDHQRRQNGHTHHSDNGC